LTHWLVFRQISFTFPDACIGEGLDSTVTDGHTGKDERVFDDEFENMRQGQKGEVGVVFGEDLVQ
jgi:hypothetical protein